MNKEKVLKIISNYKGWLSFYNRSADTIRQYSYQIIDFLNWYEKELKDIEQTDITKYINRKENKNYKIKIFYILKNFIQFLQENNYVSAEKSFLFRKRFSIDYKVKDIPSDTELEKFLNTMKSFFPKYYYIAIILKNTGMRIRELTNIKKSELKDIFINKKERIKIMGKGNKERYIYINTETEEAIKELYKVIKSKKMPQSRATQKYFHYGCELAGIEVAITPHTFRHLFITRLVENGIDLKTIMELSGHSSISSLEKYIHITEERKKQAYVSVFGK